MKRAHRKRHDRTEAVRIRNNKQSIITVHKQIARRAEREARIYDENGRRRPKSLPKEEG